MMTKVNMVQRAVEGFTLLLTLLAKVVLRQKPRARARPRSQPHSMHMSMQQMISNSDHKSMEESKVEMEVEVDDSYSLSWRLAVEANNVRPWRTVPIECYKHVENYMTGGQYEQDLNLITHQILGYAFEIPLAADGFDAWIFDVDDTCISNISYYQAKRFGCDPFDSAKFKAWITKGACPAIPMVLVLFNKLKERGFKIFLLTGRYEATLGKITTDNLHNQGFIGYERLILRSAEYKGQSAVRYKSQIRKQIEGEGYRIWGNVGDQWSDLQGDCLGNRTFKLPNPMYFIS